MIAKATGGTSVANVDSAMAGTQGRGRRAAAAAVLGGWLVSAGAAPAPRVWILSAETWAVPREGQTLLAMAPVTAAVRALLADPQSRLTLVHPASEEGALWGSEMRDWLVTLGVEPQRIGVQPATATAATAQLTLSLSISALRSTPCAASQPYRWRRGPMP